MKDTFIRLIAFVLCISLFGALIPPAYAEESTITYPIRRPAPEVENDPEDPDAAQNISGMKLVTGSVDFGTVQRLFDLNKYNALSTGSNASLTLEHASGIGYLYFLFAKEYGEYTVINNDTGERAVCGTNRFLHELIDLEKLFESPATSVTVEFSNGSAFIQELYVYTPGYLPDHIQAWEAPEDGAVDLILFSTHGDDDQLFFAGLLPYYCALDYKVMVVYMTDHRNNVGNRIHEMLNGLWHAGVRIYPVFGSFPDFFVEEKNAAYAILSRAGWQKEDLVAFITEQLRRYHPLVAVGHDFAGEYGHGQHMIYAECLAEAVEASADPNQFEDSAQLYGTWDVPKAYFHLYEENPIVMDWDTPMDELDGMTPFEVTQLLGYPQHISQQQSWVSLWINGRYFSIKKASEIQTYSPCQYGLYRSTVGEDVQKDDMFENLFSHAEQARLQAEEEARLKAEEEARIKAEEEARLKAEEEARIAREKAEAEEQARKKAEELAALEAAQAKRQLQIRIIVGISAVFAVILLVFLIRFRRKNKS